MDTKISRDEFTQHMADVFRLFGPITLRRMFAGHGIFRDGIMFGLVYKETLYLKVDEQNLHNFRDQGLTQFTYVRQGKIIGLSYYQAPEDLLDDINKAVLWARSSYEAALRANAPKAKAVRSRHKHSAEI